MSLARLDAWTLVAKTSAAEAHLAGALDLRDLALQDIEEIANCKALQVALLAQNLLSQLSSAVFSCRRLRKLDVSRNGLSGLPGADEWRKLPELQILYLHENHLPSLQQAGALASCPNLLRLTLYGNPCAKHPSYRHYCVNTLYTLRALDLNVISDEELIEGAVFSPNIGAKCPASELPLFEPDAAATEPNDKALIDIIRKELQAMNHAHARLSPVLRLQSAARGGGARRRVLVIKERLLASKPPPPPPQAPPPAAESAPAPASAEIDVDGASDLLHKERAATVIQSRVRGAEARKALSNDLDTAPPAHHVANLSLMGAPFLYVQTRHVLELEALLPPALGVANAKASYFEPTDCYTIRHAIEPPTDLSDPPLVGMLIRQRAQERKPAGLRITPSAREGFVLSRLPRTARPTNAEMRVISAALDYATKEDDSVVQRVYARRQLVRLVLPDQKLFPQVFEAAERRNMHLLQAMGMSEGDEKSPKVLSELLMPLTPQALDIVLGAVTLQRVWRSISARMKLQPSLTQRLLRLRGAVRIQRWWRWFIFKERLRMLVLVRERVLAVDSNKLYLPTAVFEDIGEQGQCELHKHKLWPEHTSLKFTFAHSQNSDVQYFVTPDALRPEMPTWCAPRMPVAQARSQNQPQEPLSLLTVGVKATIVKKEAFRSFVRRDWTCVCFTSQVEATRRVALLTAIGYEPLAMRTRHGRLQGTLFPPLFLLSWSELERHEAAARIQGAQMARISRRAFVETLNIVRVHRAERASARQAEKESNSLLATKGMLDVPGTRVTGTSAVAAEEQKVEALNSNLTREQLERMLTGQAEVLGVYGLPPVVAPSDNIGQVLADQLAREAREQRDAAAAARALIRERKAAEIIAARETTMSVIREKSRGGDRGSATARSHDGVLSSGGSPERGADGIEPSTAPSARALMQMMQAVVSQRTEMYDDAAAAQQRFTEAKRSHAASLRAELKQAHAELIADRELERQELLVQSRLERRQLQHALDERNRAFASEVVQKCEARRATKDNLSSSAQAREFTGGFVRQQNAVVRQLQLGNW